MNLHRIVEPGEPPSVMRSIQLVVPAQPVRVNAATSTRRFKELKKEVVSREVFEPVPIFKCSYREDISFISGKKTLNGWPIKPGRYFFCIL